VALKDLMGHRRIETTLVYLRRLNRMRSMETVRSFDWGGLDPGTLESKPGTEKEGFEPSLEANPHERRAGTQHGGRLDEVLLELVQAGAENPVPLKEAGARSDAP
jgi:hypothetical protein